MEERQIDFSRFTRVAESAKQNAEPQLRPRSEIERNPTYTERRAEVEGRSTWSGGVWGGRVDRSR